jgi:thermitase
VKEEERMANDAYGARMMRRGGSLCFGFSVLLAVLAGCGGGGSSSGGSSSVVPPGSPSPTPSATSTSGTSGQGTGAPTFLSASSCTTGVDVLSKRKAQALSTAAPTTTTFTINSNPSGMPVYINTNKVGTTSYSSNPSPADAAYVVTIGTSSASANYCYSQIADGATKTLYYNSVSDTSGSIGSISTFSIERSAQSVASNGSTANITRHALRSAPSPTYADNKLLVKYRATTLQSTARNVLSIENSAGIASGVNLGPQSGELLSRVVTIPSGTSLESVRSRLAADPAVSEVDPIGLRYPMSVVPVYPNDPGFATSPTQAYQWDMYQIQMPSAWGVTEGLSSVAIAIIDTGYDANSPDLSGKVTIKESVLNGTVTSGNAAVQDSDGHGTNVSGIAAAATNNATEVAGVGYNVMLQEYKIFSSGGANASTSDEAAAIYQAVNNGAKVISLSLGGTQGTNGIDTAEYDAVEYAIAQGDTVVAAAGNERLDGGVSSVDYPAAYPGVIAVGASALNDTSAPGVRSSATEYVASYSNSGPGLTLVAPGGDPTGSSDTDGLHWITNLDTFASGCGSQSNCLAEYAGTSQATPHVAGAAALMLSLNPALSPSQIKTILSSTADNINDARQGAGRLNVYRAVSAVSGTTVATPQDQNFVAFAYSNMGVGATTPSIIDLTFPQGVPVSSAGAFRLSDISPGVTSYRIAVWLDTNGDGVVDQGDYIGTSSLCSNAGPCNSASGISVGPVATGYTLP